MNSTVIAQNISMTSFFFNCLQRMLEALLIERPSDPLSFLAAYLERAENDGMCLERPKRTRDDD